MMSKPKHLHPLAIIIQVTTTAYQYLISLVLLIIFIMRDTKGVDDPLWFIIGGIALFICIFIWSFITWNCYTYYIEDKFFRIQYGMLIKKTQTIPLERIQSVNIVEELLHRFFSVVKVKVETAGNSGAKVELLAVSHKEAERLQSILTVNTIQKRNNDINKGFSNKADIHESHQAYKKIKIKNLLIHALTSGSLSILFPFVGVCLSILENFISMETMFGFIIKHIHVEINFLFILVAASCITLVALIASIASISVTILKYYNLCVSRHNGNLIIERGLLNRYRASLPLNRIQAVQLKEGIVKQLFGLVTIRVIYHGGGLEEGSKFSLVVFPILRRYETESFLQKFLPEYAIKNISLVRPPRRSWCHFVAIDFIVIGFVSAIITFSFFPWGALSILLAPIALIYGHLCYKDEGWYLSGTVLVIRSRLSARTTTFITHRRIQSSTVTQTPIQRRYNLTTFEYDIAGSVLGTTITLNHIDKEDGYYLLNWY